MKTKRYVPYLVVFSMIFCLFLALSAIGVSASSVDVEVKGDDDTSIINLTQETITLAADFEVGSYSIDGEKWKLVGSKDFGKNILPKLFSKDMTNLSISASTELGKIGSGKNKVPVVDGTEEGSKVAATDIVKFPKINKRAALDKLVINYALFADNAKTPDTESPYGKWTLAKKDDPATTDAANFVAVSPADKKPTAGELYTAFAPQPVKKDKDDAKTAVWFVKVNAKEVTENVEYTAASKTKKYAAKPAAKAPSFTVKDIKVGDNKVKGIKVKKNMNYFEAEGTVQSTGDGSTLVAPIITPGKYTIWTPATAKKPASIRQTGLEIMAPETTIP